MEQELLKNTKKTGDLGEEIAVKYLKSKGFKIEARNYRKKYGEIDIVARGTMGMDEPDLVSYETFGKGKSGLLSRETSIVHFVEVKSVSYETKERLKQAVSHETWRPEELVHEFKLNQIRKTAETWVVEHDWSGEVQVDVIAVRIVLREKYAIVKYLSRIISE